MMPDRQHEDDPGAAPSPDPEREVPGVVAVGLDYHINHLFDCHNNLFIGFELKEKNTYL